MIRSAFTIRTVATVVVFLLVVAACGDDASGADPERFCEIDAELDQLDDPFELPSDEAREVVRKGTDLIDEAVQVAPDEIRVAVETAAGSFTAISDLLEEADFDAAQVDVAEIDAAFEAAFSGDGGDAVEAMDEWVAANCSA